MVVDWFDVDEDVDEVEKVDLECEIVCYDYEMMVWYFWGCEDGMLIGIWWFEEGGELM